MARQRVFVLAVLTALATGVAPETIAGGGCITAVVAWPIVFPDGSSHPSGLLRLCDTRAFSPVTRLHETSINGVTVGLLLSRAFRSEAGDGARPLILFRRERSGQLRLLAYTIPTRGGAVTFDLSATDRWGRPPAAEPAVMTVSAAGLLRAAPR